MRRMSGHARRRGRADRDARVRRADRDADLRAASRRFLPTGHRAHPQRVGADGYDHRYACRRETEGREVDVEADPERAEGAGVLPRRRHRRHRAGRSTHRSSSATTSRRPRSPRADDLKTLELLDTVLLAQHENCVRHRRPDHDDRVLDGPLRRQRAAPLRRAAPTGRRSRPSSWTPPSRVCRAPTWPPARCGSRPRIPRTACTAWTSRPGTSTRSAPRATWAARARGSTRPGCGQGRVHTLTVDPTRDADVARPLRGQNVSVAIDQRKTTRPRTM